MWITVPAFFTIGIWPRIVFTFALAMPQLNQVWPGPDVCGPEVVACRAAQPKSGRASAPQAFMALGEMHQLGRHGGQRGQAGRFPAPTGFLLPKSLNPRLGRRVFFASRQCFVPRAGTTQNSGGTKPFSVPAKTSGNRRWIPIDNQ
jgi:hypothetical protein